MQYLLNEYHRNLSDEDLIIDLKSVATQTGKHTVTMAEYDRWGKYHSTTLKRRFGSWFRCLELAGLSPSRSKINIPEEELFLNLENLWRHFGRQPKYYELVKPLSKFSAGTYENRYGTYYNALGAFIAAMNGEVIESKKTPANPTINPRSINYRLRFKVMQRDHFRCCICGASPSVNPGTILHIDHIVPCAKGGQATMDNLQTLCDKCNLGKSDLDMYP